jgi:predicted methyltransferase
MTTWRLSAAALGVVACSFGLGCARSGTPPVAREQAVIRVAHPGVTPFIRAVVQDPDRLDADRALDAGRHPEELLAFLEVAPGLLLGEIGAGGGYTTELVARAVGERGRIYAENNRLVLERFAAKPWADRLQRRALRNVVRVDREFDDPLPPEARDLDGVYVVLFYHDTVWMGADRDRMNRAVFDALRPGGFYVIIDHVARAGSRGRARRVQAARGGRLPAQSGGQARLERVTEDGRRAAWHQRSVRAAIREASAEFFGTAGWLT